MRKLLFLFLAGFVATFVFHQGLIGLFYLFEVIPMAPFNMTPTKPLGVPAVISLAFFGGLWAFPVWYLLQKSPQGRQKWMAFLYGAIGPTAVAFIIVFPLKGQNVPVAFIPFGLLLNGFWGYGVWLFMRLTRQDKR
jgi:hypothetical protein